MSLEFAREVLESERAAITAVLERMGEALERTLERIESIGSGRVVCCGVGKAGLIARKVSATLASTGTESISLHPADALHGDLGMVRGGDVALIFSNSGETDEISRLLPYLRRQGLALVAITSSPRSTLGVQADFVLELGDLEEACPLGLAPTASTTAMLALGDALAIALMRRRGFSSADYAALHPAGELGRKALRVREVMRGADAAAILQGEVQVGEALDRITAARAGAAIVVDPAGGLLGIFTDGDLRRRLLEDPEVLGRPIASVMVRTAHAVHEDAPASQAVSLLREHRIGELPVLDADDRVVGMVDLKGLIAAGVSG
jgi:arabinose-5-phosphate isomerase